MKVYEIRYDNGECYEDQFSYTVALFSSRESAVNNLENVRNLVYNESNDCWEPKKYKCKNVSDAICLGCEFYDKEWTYGMKIGSLVDNYDCKQYDDRFEEEYDNSFYKIYEWEVLD